MRRQQLGNHLEFEFFRVGGHRFPLHRPHYRLKILLGGGDIYPDTGGPGGNSPYTAALAQTMAQSGLTLWQTFNTVGLQVKEDTGGVQKPWISNEPIKGEFCFSGCAGAVPSAKEEELRECIRQLEAAQAQMASAPPATGDSAAEGRTKPVLSAAEKPASAGVFRQTGRLKLG